VCYFFLNLSLKPLEVAKPVAERIIKPIRTSGAYVDTVFEEYRTLSRFCF
jgi:hypothetical protein